MKDKLIIKGSINSIKSELCKRGLLFLITLFTYFKLESLNNSLKSKYKINNLMDSFAKFDTSKILGIVYIIGVTILVFLVLILMLYCALKTLQLAYDFSSKIIIDLDSNTITYICFSFLFSHVYEEHKVDEIIGVTISKGIFDTLLDCGDIYIEYICYTKTDSQLKGLFVPRVANPNGIRKILLDNNV